MSGHRAVLSTACAIMRGLGGAFGLLGRTDCRQAVADSAGAWSVDFSAPGSGGCDRIGDFILGSHATISQGGLDPDGDRTTIDAVVHDFTDDNGNTFEMDITWLYQEGITKGCNPPDNTEYCPNDYVTRGQMAAFLRRALS